MRYRHKLFQPLHFDFGTTAWSVNHMPMFGAILSVLDYRRLGTIHNITFLAMMKVLTNGSITEKQAQAIFNLLDLTLTGDLNYSELAFMVAIIAAQKDHMEREFLYMNAWKMWVIFNEHGKDRITTREFRRTGLFFDFNYPTIYEMFRDYNWDDEKEMEFERFRFYLMSCIHFRQVHRFQAKYIRYRQFKRAVLLLLQKILRKVLIENIYPSPMSVLKAIKTIKIPPLEGTERTKAWTDLLECNFIRRYVKNHFEVIQRWFIFKTKKCSPRMKCFCKCICCGFCCYNIDDDVDQKCCGDCDHFCAKNCYVICKYCKCHRGRDASNFDKKDKRSMGIINHPQKAKEQEITPALERSSKDDIRRSESVVVPQSVKETHKNRKKVRMMLTREDAIPEVEWRPLGRPRCGIQ